MILDEKMINKIDLNKIKSTGKGECACCHKAIVLTENSAIFSHKLNQGICLSCYYQAGAPVIVVDDLTDNNAKKVAKIALINRCVKSINKDNKAV